MNCSTRLNVLYVEDNPADALLLREALAEAGTHIVVHVAETGSKALEFLRHRTCAAAPMPDLILLDWNLPAITGAAVLAYIRRDEQWSPIPVLVYTSSRCPQDRLVAESHRAGFETKPATWPEAVDFAHRLQAFMAKMASGPHPWVARS